MEPAVKTEPVQELIGLNPNKKNHSFKKLFISLLVVLVVLLLAVSVFFLVLQKSNKTKSTSFVTPTPTSAVSGLPKGVDSTTATLETQSVSDEITVIESDLNATSLDDIDKELTDIETELSLP